MATGRGMTLLAQITRPDGHRVITAHGELDRTELPALRVAIQNVLDESAPALILDMAEVTYIDSSASLSQNLSGLGWSAGATTITSVCSGSILPGSASRNCSAEIGSLVSTSSFIS